MGRRAHPDGQMHDAPTLCVRERAGRDEKGRMTHTDTRRHTPRRPVAVWLPTRAWRGWLPAGMLVLLLVAGTALRLTGLTRQSLWLDEAFSLYVAAHRFAQILAFVAGSDAHPPLYYLVLHVWLLFGPSVLALRVLSALASSGSLVAMFALSRRLAPRRVALLASALMASSAFQVWYAQEVRMYALVTLAVLIAVYALVRAWQQGGVGAWVVFTAALLAALYLDYSAFYVYSALVIWLVVVGRHRAPIRRPFVLSSLVLVLGYLPWLPAFWRQLVQIGGLTAWIGTATGTGLTHVLTDLLFNRTNLSQADVGPSAVLTEAVSLVLVAAALWLPRRRPAYPLLALWLGWPCALGVAAGLLGHPILIARNIMVVQPALFVLLAMALDDVWMSRRGSRLALLRRAPVVLCLGLFVAANLHAQMLSWTSTLKEDWRGAAALVAAHRQSGDLVLFNAYFTQMPFDYYFLADVRADRAVRAPVTERGYQTDESLLFANLAPPGPGIQSGPELAAYARVWLVLSHDDTRTTGAAVPPWLAQHDHLVHQQHFVGVTVQLYQVSAA